jgi:hypothetical protein
MNYAKVTLLSSQEQDQQYFVAYNDISEIEKTLKKIPSKWRHSFCEPLQCSPLLKYI